MFCLLNNTISGIDIHSRKLLAESLSITFIMNPSVSELVLLADTRSIPILTHWAAGRKDLFRSSSLNSESRILIV